MICVASRITCSTMNTAADRLRAAREDAGFASAETAARALNISATTYRAHENGQNQFKPADAQRYAKKFKCNATWLLLGDSNDVQHMSPQRRGDIASFNIHAGMGGGGALSVILDEEHGEIIDPQDSDGFWSFPDRVRNGFRQMNRTYAMPVTGDSMEPTLPNGAFVFIDTTHVVPSPEDIYALDYGDGLMVKRVKLVPKTNRVRIISDNPRYGEDELLREELQVYGRVVAFFQWR